MSLSTESIGIELCLLHDNNSLAFSAFSAFSRGMNLLREYVKTNTFADLAEGFDLTWCRWKTCSRLLCNGVGLSSIVDEVSCGGVYLF
jgi:hypothetical protein